MLANLRLMLHLHYYSHHLFLQKGNFVTVATSQHFAQNQSKDSELYFFAAYMGH
jgi:hypothetical protein